MIKLSNFEQVWEGVYASENAHRIIITEWGKSLRGVITYPSGGHKMGWRRILRT